LAIFHSHPSLFPSRHNTSPSPPSSQHAHPPCLLLPHCSRHQQPPASSLSSHGVLPFSPSATAARRPLLLLPHAAAAGAPFSSSLVSTATSRELGFFSMALPPCRSPAASPRPALPILPPARAPTDLPSREPFPLRRSSLARSRRAPCPWRCSSSGFSHGSPSAAHPSLSLVELLHKAAAAAPMDAQKIFLVPSLFIFLPASLPPLLLLAPSSLSLVRQQGAPARTVATVSKSLRPALRSKNRSPAQSPFPCSFPMCAGCSTKCAAAPTAPRAAGLLFCCAVSSTP
jgi:hypothetical protein